MALAGRIIDNSPVYANGTRNAVQKIVAGEVPGLSKQWDLFRDMWGHPQPPLQILDAYCHYAVIYGRNPAGLAAPSVIAKLPEADKLNALLQKLAWDAVTAHPLSGVKGKAVATRRYDRAKLLADDVVSGPALIVQHNSTTLVPPGYSANVLSHGDMRIARLG